MEKAQHALQETLEKIIDNKKVFGTSFCIYYKGQHWSGSAGDLNSESQYFIASVTKLFTTAVILRLRQEKKLNLDDKISKYLDNKILEGLHVFKGINFSDSITVRHLLAHTSGLPDYFEDKNKEGISLEEMLLSEEDNKWSFEDCIAISKTIQPIFKPGDKAHYSDTNFQLLGKIAENITQKSISEIYEDLITNPLGLAHTYLYKNAHDSTPSVFYYKDKKLLIPNAMTSFGADGGIVSTSEELIKFIKAFFEGKLFPSEYIDEMQTWNKIFFPFQSGIGIQRFKLLWIFDPLRTIPELIGHSGLSGTLAYCSPEQDLYIAGTVNQVAYRDMSFKVAIKLLQKLKNK